MPKKRCSRCGSLKTEKRGAYGIKSAKALGKRTRRICRYHCLGCNNWFSNRAKGRRGTQRYEPSVIFKATELYFNAEASYRAVARQLHVRPYQIFEWLNELGANCKPFEDVAHELQPRYEGYLLADGTAIPIAGQKQHLLLTADAGSQDIPYAELHKSESYPGWKATLMGLRGKIGYPARGAVVDGDAGLLRALHEVFPHIPIQLCVRHAYSRLAYRLKYVLPVPGQQVQSFLDMAHRLLYASSKQHRDQLLHEYNPTRWYIMQSPLRAELYLFESKFHYLWTHFDHPGLPRTSNIIESIIDKLKHKITDCHGFEYRTTAWNCLKMVIMNYRFHKFTCSRINGHNGKAPLQLTAAQIDNLDWVRFSQK